MPRGSYALSGPDGPIGTEHFSCAAGPAGWRYVGRRESPDGRPTGLLDLTVDASWRVVRLHAEAGAWSLRGGVVGAQAVWRRGDAEHSERAAGFTGTSPAFAVGTARLLALEPGGTARLRLVRLSGALAALTVDEGWGRTPDVAGVERYEAADLATGERRVVHLAGDVVVDGTGVDLLTLTQS